MSDEWKVAQGHELESWMETDMSYGQLLGVWEEKLPQIKFITEMIDRSTKTLDIGCGPVPILHVLPRTELMVAADPLNEEYKKKYPRKDYILYKDFIAESVPYDDNTFNVIFCINALDHMKDPKKALIEMFRVLNNGGLLYLEYENTSPLPRFLNKLGYAKHLNEYHPHLISTAEVFRILKDTGHDFEVVKTSFRPQFTFDKVRFLFALIFGRKRMTSYEKSISSVSRGPLGFLIHTSIIFFERLGYFFDPQRFSYFTSLIIKRK